VSPAGGPLSAGAEGEEEFGVARNQVRNLGSMPSATQANPARAGDPLQVHVMILH